MKNQWQKGSSNLLGIGIIVAIAIIMLSQSGSGLRSGWTSGSGGAKETKSFWQSNGSSGGGQVAIGTGNASYVYQPYEEYITLDNSGRSPINITGWQLKNGKDKRPYYLGSMLQRFSADTALIPQASLILSPAGASLKQDVVLGKDERAIVTTGSFGVRSPIAVSSFKENMCTGYIEGLPDYAFTPALSRNCPSPRTEPGIENLDRDCRRVVERLSSCETPQIGERRGGEEYCSECYEGQILSSNCRAFIEAHFSYQGCLIYHQSDPNFSSNTWRIFLGRGWEMWSDEYETIELFDSSGVLVDYENY